MDSASAHCKIIACHKKHITPEEYHFKFHCTDREQSSDHVLSEQNYTEKWISLSSRQNRRLLLRSDLAEQQQLPARATLIIGRDEGFSNILRRGLTPQKLKIDHPIFCADGIARLRLRLSHNISTIKLPKTLSTRTNAPPSWVRTRSRWKHAVSCYMISSNFRVFCWKRNMTHPLPLRDIPWPLPWSRYKPNLTTIAALFGSHQKNSSPS